MITRFGIDLDEGEIELLDSLVKFSGLKTRSALFRLMLYKYDREVRKIEEKNDN